MKPFNRAIVGSIFYAFSITLLTACGGGGGGGGGGGPAAATPVLTFEAIKTFRFSWTDVSDATHYKLLENPDSSSGFTQVGSDIPQGTQTIDHVVPLYARLNAQYILQTCDDLGCTNSANMAVSGTLVDSIGYFKASNTDVEDFFGQSVSLSGDGNTLAVGAYLEDSNATGIDGDQTDNTAALDAGAVYVFSRNGTSWNQQAYIKASNTEVSKVATETGDAFGFSVSLSDDGNTLAVGAPGEDSGATGVDGDQADNAVADAGAVYVFSRVSGSWSQQAYVKTSNPDIEDLFGIAVSLSGDGLTLAAGSIRESSIATGIDGNQADNTALNAGAVYVFSCASGSWNQQAYVKASNTDIEDLFGLTVSLSADGNTLAVGAPNEGSSAIGINGDQADNTAANAGAVYVFTRASGSWSQQAYVKASNTDIGDIFGWTAVSLSADGNALAVGARSEESSATGINGDQASNDSTGGSGAVYVFSRASGSWSQQAYVKASNTGGDDEFGRAVSLSGDGNTLAVASREDSIATGIGGDQTDDTAFRAGAVYVFSRTGGSWSQQAYVKASNTDSSDHFGSAVNLSADGSALAVGAWFEGSNATGINGDQTDNSTIAAGAVYVY